jgi:adenylate kinase
MKKIFVFLGAPGSGKGLLGDRLSQALSIPKMATGDVLRAEVKRKTELGASIASYVSGGILVDDEIVTPMVLDFLKKAPDAAILDGYPRNMQQFRQLIGFVRQNDVQLVGVYLETPIPFILKRIEQRRVCVDCGKTNFASAGRCVACGGQLKRRPDDALIQARMRQYLRETRPVEMALFSQADKFIEIDASNIDLAWVNMHAQL